LTRSIRRFSRFIVFPRSRPLCWDTFVPLNERAMDQNVNDTSPSRAHRNIGVLSALALLFLGLLGMVGCQHEPPVVPEEVFNGGGGGGTGPDPLDPCDPGTVYFQQQVLPIFISNCAVPGCHNLPTDENNDIQITSYESLMNSGMINMGDPFNSDLWESINDSDPDNRMPRPPQVPLPASQIAIIQQWLAQGAQNNSCENVTCDTLNVTYSGTIVPLIQQRCQGCHSGGSPQGGLNFTSWATVNSVATDGRLGAAIQHLPTGIAMPPSGGRLSDCRIQQFLIWIDAGAPNN